MTRRRSRTFIAAGGVLAVVGALALPVAASAAPGDDILVFSNGSVVDTTPGQEYDMISAAITAGGFDVEPFDGGDGSQAAWETALTDIEVFVLPEQEPGSVYDPGSPPSWMSTDAFDAIIDWVQAGGTMLISGSCSYDQAGSLFFFNAAIGVDYTNVLGNCTELSITDRFISDTELPDALTYANGNYTLDLGDFSEAQLAPLTVWYAGATCAQEQLSAGVFAAGDGQIAFDAWDYYPDSGVDQASWDEVLVSLIDGNAAASSWEPSGDGAGPEPGSVTATTAEGESLYSINSTLCGEEEAVVYQVDPETAMAAPTTGVSNEGWAYQGAWDPTTETAYLPYDDFDEEELVLAIVDPTTGVITPVAEFSTSDPDIEYLDNVYGLAIGSDGAAYLFAEIYDGDEDWMALFSVDLETAELTTIRIYGDEDLNDPNGFAVNPVDGTFYAMEEDDVDDAAFELFEVDVETGDLTSVGFVESPSIEESSDSNALQIGVDGTFWFSFDIYSSDYDREVSVIATFLLADFDGGVVTASESGILTDDQMWTGSLLLVPGAQLAATGAETELPLGVAALLLLLGTALITARLIRRRTA